MDGKNKSSASVLKGLSSDERAKLTMLGHISTLLTTGHPTIDAKATVSNAVTGQIHPGSITLVCSLDETNVSGEAKTELIRINAVGDSVSAEPDKSGQELLDNWSTVEDPKDDQFYDTHISQVARMLAHIWSTDHPKGLKITHVRNLQSFMIRRARSKIVARVDNLVNLWGECPIEIMQTWYKDHPDAVLESTVRLPYWSVTPTLAAVLKEHSLRPLPDRPDHYPISSASIHSWLEVVKNPLARILEALGDTRVAPSSRQTRLAHDAIDDLFAILHSTLSRVLQMHGVDEALQNAYEDPDKEAKAVKAKKAQKAQQPVATQEAQDADTEGAMDAGTVETAGQGGKSPEDSTGQVQFPEGHFEPTLSAYIDEDSDDGPSSEPEEGENAVQHLFRYLSTITAWNKAVLSLVAAKGIFSELNVFIVKNLPQIVVTLADIDEPISRYEALLRDGIGAQYQGPAYTERLKVITDRMNKVKQNLRLNQKNVGEGEVTLNWVRDRCRVHAEAALMGLAWTHSEGTTPAVDGIELDTLFPEGRVIIGSLDGPISFVLPGTHAVIFPWLPPPGIPENALIKIREGLFGVLHARVCEPVVDYSSNQSSPVDEDANLDLFYNFVGIQRREQEM
ncbi:hypothetical protein BN946_scf184897.g1 [Trametes cinnabarina]|uniref:Uncharacterized protein n=1 Tax=Pycnoporus cinnabarinus TaxID=5643 RepID=A0A060SQ32_PYCCI|nr:hypothetical protein BN946_scf184897.g1 [Trametes cinnabarina]